MPDTRAQLTDAVLVAVSAAILLAVGVAVAALLDATEPPCPDNRRVTGWSGGRYTVLCLPAARHDPEAADTP